MAGKQLVNGALIALAVASSLALWHFRDKPGTTELEARKNKLLPSFRRQDVRKLTLRQGGRLLELTRSSATEDFRIVQPWAERADPASVNQLLEALELASWLRPAPKTPAVGSGPDVLVIELGLPAQTLQLRLNGLATAAGVHYVDVLAETGTQSYVVSRGLKDELDVPFYKFRETRLLEYGRRELKRLLLTSKLGKLQIEQRAHGAFYFTDQGRTELVDPVALEHLLTALSRVSSEQDVEPEQARAALQSEPVTVAIETTVAGAAPLTLSFAAGCPAAPELAVVLREESGKTARAGCVPSDVASALRVRADDLRLNAPFAATLDAVEELSLRSGARKLELARKDKAWILRSAGNRELGLEAGNRRVSAILGARGQRAAADAKSLGLEPPAGELVIQVAGSDEASHREERVLLGRARADGSLCLERQLDGVRLCFDKNAAEAFDADASLLRSPEVLHFAPSELAELSIDTPELHERLTRSSDGGYTLEEPKGFRHDGSLVADAVQSLGTLQAVRWVAADAEPKHGFAAPRLHVVARLTSGATPELTVGATTEGGAYARLAADPAVFVIGTLALADLETPLIERALCPFPSQDLSRIELRQGARSLTLSRSGDGWQAGNLAPARAAELADALSALRAEQALHLGAARPAEGLDKPRAVITFTDRQGKTLSVSLGARSSWGNEPVVFARLEGTDATFALLARTAEDLLTSF